jgi:hypothetical protein
MPNITDKTTLADAEQQALTGYERNEMWTEGADVVEEVQKAPVAPFAPVVAAEPQVSESSADAAQTAGAILDAWFENSIHNSEYSRDATKYNGIQKAYRALRVLIT